ncbi:MAG: FKBP-type peptidyl-prolyl cis-trans isomerase [Gemmatimonadaceae bacterium]
MHRSRPLASLAVAIVASACLDGAPFIPRIEDTNFDPSLGVDLAASTKTASGVYYRDITVGTGPQVPADSGDTVFVRYTGYLRNAVVFDSNVDAVSPLRFVTGQREVIVGFEEGIYGILEGGQRQIIIPPLLAYGGSPPPGSGIPDYSILVFTVTVTRVGLLPDPTP